MCSEFCSPVQTRISISNPAAFLVKKTEKRTCQKDRRSPLSEKGYSVMWVGGLVLLRVLAQIFQIIPFYVSIM